MNLGVYMNVYLSMSLGKGNYKKVMENSTLIELQLELEVNKRNIDWY